MLRSASLLLRTAGGSQQYSVSTRILPCLRKDVITTRLFCAAAKKSKAKKAKKAKKGDAGEENDKEEEWISNLIDTAEAVRK